jgi:hypothetical protein
MPAYVPTVRMGSTLAVGYLVIQAVIGYEWFASGLTKLVHADFPAGLAADLHDREKDAASWYRHFLNSSVIPHASTFGYLIEIVELAAGVVLIATAVIFLWRRSLDAATTRVMAGATALAALAGLVLAVNFVLANGVGFGPIGPDSFDEGVGLDALLVGLQLVVLAVSVAVMKTSDG